MSDERIAIQARARQHFKRPGLSPIDPGGGYPMRLVPRAELPPERRPALLPGRKSRRRRRNVWVRA